MRGGGQRTSTSTITSVASDHDDQASDIETRSHFGSSIASVIEIRSSVASDHDDDAADADAAASYDDAAANDEDQQGP